MKERSISALSAAIAMGLVCFVLWNHESRHGLVANAASLAYRAGYGEHYQGPPAPHAAIADNIYARTPRSEWQETAYKRVTAYVDELERDCDPFTPVGTRTLTLSPLPKGDWRDYVAGSEQALQDMAAGIPAHTMQPAGYLGVDCD